MSLSSGLAGPTRSTVEGVNEFGHRQPAWLQRLSGSADRCDLGALGAPVATPTRPAKDAPAGWRWAIRPDRSLGSSSGSSTSDSEP